MGFLQNGEWQAQDEFPTDQKGDFVRQQTTFRDTINPQHNRFQPASGRYHLYVSLACPWAHRTLIMRQLKGLEGHISISVVHPHMLDDGWSFDQQFVHADGDQLFHFNYLREVYLKAKADYTGRVTVPVLWDRQEETIVNNESAEILRLLNSSFNQVCQNHDDYYPEHLRSDIDTWNDLIYPNVNNGVYRSGFAKSQESYENAVRNLFQTLEKINDHLADTTYLCGDKLTEADIRLFTTLIRFDCVYHYHFKCNIKKLSDLPHVHCYLRTLYEIPAFQKTTNFAHIKEHYYYSHKSLNPYRIIPLGPEQTSFP
jgi:putative glutathione S-transferase